MQDIKPASKNGVAERAHYGIFIPFVIMLALGCGPEKDRFKEKAIRFCRII